MDKRNTKKILPGLRLRALPNNKIWDEVGSFYGPLDGEIVSIDYRDDRYAWIKWDGDHRPEPHSGFFGNLCACEVISGQGPHTLAEAYAAGVLLYNELDNQILTVSRKDNPEDFGIPGGKLEPGETPIEAAIRELFEETGVKIDPAYLDVVWVRVGRYKPFASFMGMIRKDTVLTSPETGVVKWNDPDVARAGTFGNYNTALLKLAPRPTDPVLYGIY